MELGFKKSFFTGTLWTALLFIAPFFLWGTAMVAMKGVIPQTTPFFFSRCQISPRRYISSHCRGYFKKTSTPNLEVLVMD